VLAALWTNGWLRKMHVRLKGINRSVKRLADGTVKTFWYAWRGGPRLTGEPGSPEFVASYNAAVATKISPAPGTLRSVFTAYQQSSAFTDLRDRSRKDYARHIARIEAKFASFPLAAFSDPRTRGIFLAWRDEIGLTSPRSADCIWAVLNTAVSWGLDRGLVPCNPFTKGGRLAHGTRGDKSWAPDDELRFFASAPEYLHLSYMLGVWTGQRQGDLLRLPWSAYDGTHIRLKQSKGGRRVVVRVAEPLKIALDAAAKAKRGPLILANSLGLPWTTNAFKEAWRRAKKAAGIKGLTFHDLRGTFVTRAALAGSTEIEIAAITGHSLRDVRSILDSNYLHRDQLLGEAAIRKLETRTNLQTGLQTAHNPQPVSQEKKP
jgi:integrase